MRLPGGGDQEKWGYPADSSDINTSSQGSETILQMMSNMRG